MTTSEAHERLRHRTRRLGEEILEARTGWSDAAAIRVTQRYLNPLRSASVELVDALEAQQVAASAATDLAGRVAERASAGRTHLDQVRGHLSTTEESVRSVVEEGDVAVRAGAEAEARLDEALDALARAGGRCGEGIGRGALNAQLKEPLGADDDTIVYREAVRSELVKGLAGLGLGLVGEAIKRDLPSELVDLPLQIHQHYPVLRIQVADAVTSIVERLRG